MAPGPLNLGFGQPSDLLKGAIRVRNEGGQDLLIHRIEASCGCAWIQKPASKIAPGAAIDIPVAARAKADGAKSLFQVRISTNDPVTPESLINLSMGADPLILADPQEVNFASLPVGQGGVVRVALFKPDGSHWPRSEVLDVAAQEGRVQATIVQAGGIEPPASELQVVLPKDSPSGSLQDAITIRPCGGERALRLRVLGQIVPSIVVSPSVVSFRGKAENRPVDRHILVRPTDGRALGAIDRVQSSNGIEIIDAEKQRLSEPGRARRLIVRLHPGCVNENCESEVLIWLKGESRPVACRAIVALDHAQNTAQGEAALR